MSIMMSDSLKDIVSIGQLTGEISHVELTIDDDQYDLDLFSFTRDATSLRLLAFASRSIVSSAMKAKNLMAIAKFEGEEIGKGKIISLGFETIFINSDAHDMIMLHIKRNN